MYTNVYIGSLTTATKIFEGRKAKIKQKSRIKELSFRYCFSIINNSKSAKISLCAGKPPHTNENRSTRTARFTAILKSNDTWPAAQYKS